MTKHHALFVLFACSDACGGCLGTIRIRQGAEHPTSQADPRTVATASARPIPG